MNMKTEYKAGKRLGLNIRPEVAAKLVQMQEELLRDLGVKLSVSGVVEYLINKHYQTKEK
jgi:hypothetical protein